MRAETVAVETQELLIVKETHQALWDGNRKSWLVADNYLKLSRLGWSQEAIAEEFKTSQSSVSRFISCSENYALPHNRPRFWDAYREIDGKSPRTLGTGQDEWYTPPEHLELVRRALGGIDLDPASCEAAQANVKAERFFSEAEDGLSQSWHGRVFLNPPYSQPKVGLFLDKLLSSYNHGVTAAVTLTTNNTDTDWFQGLAFAAHAICFTDGRISFIAPDGRKPSPNQGHVFCYLGEDVASFVDAFGGVGVIMYPNPG